MILHTVVPYGMIMGSEVSRPADYRSVGGVPCQVQNGCIQRLCTTDPSAFLDPKLAPGRQLPPGCRRIYYF